MIRLPALPSKIELAYFVVGNASGSLKCADLLARAAANPEATLLHLPIVNCPLALQELTYTCNQAHEMATSLHHRDDMPPTR